MERLRSLKPLTLQLDGISYHPPASSRPILDNISFDLGFPELGLIVGPSGSGKTTLLELLAGLVIPQQGQVKWHDQELNYLQLRQLAGLVFQFPERHFCGHTVLEELRLGHPEISREQVKAALVSVGLGDLPFSASPYQLSGGQQRRLALAVQLIRQPCILLLDEPTAGLDWSMRRQLIQLFQELKKTWGLLIVTHEPQELAAIADRQWAIVQGQLEPWQASQPAQALSQQTTIC
ncbi:ABC transporter ATP-binding protein [Synechococcus elongatus]|uniref:ABC transporter ATP-binding protein n=1 Tax=Synechococcus elongatus PCC 11801 TaxID=2219813 RepID=A0AAN1QKR0_SYNEL|nr:ABC transporter ATP-binding protein [Synechococcus elongatus]AZB71344.1 ABC transporter ATP-binding protein [Synechococcus elongatus PCC 11801]